MLASLQDRQPWLKPGALGGPHRVSLESYMVRCAHCLRQPCAHGPYVKLVIGRHRRGKRTRIHIPREIVSLRRRGGAPSTAGHSGEPARDRHALGALLASPALRAVAMDPGEQLVAHVAARQAKGKSSRPAQPRGAEPSHRRSESSSRPKPAPRGMSPSKRAAPLPSNAASMVMPMDDNAEVSWTCRRHGDRGRASICCAAPPALHGSLTRERFSDTGVFVLRGRRRVSPPARSWRGPAASHTTNPPSPSAITTIITNVSAFSAHEWVPHPPGASGGPARGRGRRDPRPSVAFQTSRCPFNRLALPQSSPAERAVQAEASSRDSRQWVDIAGWICRKLLAPVAGVQFAG